MSGTRSEPTDAKEAKTTITAAKDEDFELYTILRQHRESPARATPIVKLAEDFLQGVKNVETNLITRLASPTPSDYKILAQWIKEKHPNYLDLPVSSFLSAREITFIGLLYSYGVLTQNPQQAFALFQAASKDDLVAQSLLGSAYKNGEGIEENTDEAKHHLTEASTKGCVLASNHLALLLEYEFEDAPAAFLHFQKAAEDCPWARSNLGLCYKTGYGIGQNDQYAFKYISESIAHGGIDFDYLGNLYWHGTATTVSVGRAAICYRNFVKLSKKCNLKLDFMRHPNLGSCHDYQTLLAYREDDPEVKPILQTRFQSDHLPYSPKVVDLLFSLSIETLEQADSLDHNDIERIAITWNVFTEIFGFPQGAFTNILLEYLFPITEVVKQVKESEIAAKTYVGTLSLFKPAQLLALIDADDYTASFQKALRRS